MNIIELCLSPAKGGLELYAFRCAVELSKTDKVTAVVRKDGALEGMVKTSQVEYILSKVSFKPFPLLAAIKLARVFSGMNTDIVHVHWVKDLPLVALAKKISSRKPKVIFTRQMQITRDKKDFYHRFVYKEVNKFIAITQRVATDLKKYLPDFCSTKIEVLYYGVPQPSKFISDNEKQNLRKELGVSNDTFLAGLFGRIKKEKGQHLLIDAIEMLVKKNNLDTAALIVGHPMKDVYLDELKKEVAERGLDNRILFKDFVDNPQSLMQVCDVIVLASYEETFGLVLAEAMRAGIVVIGSNSGGVPEIINHMQDGMLFNAKNSDDLYYGLKLLAEDAGFRNKIAESGKQKADVMFNDKEHFIKLRELITG